MTPNEYLSEIDALIDRATQTAGLAEQLSILESAKTLCLRGESNWPSHAFAFTTRRRDIDRRLQL